MILVSTIHALTLFATAAGTPTEAAIDRNGRAFCMVLNAERSYADMWAFIDDTPLETLGCTLPDRVGPVMWGIVDDDVFVAYVSDGAGQWDWTSTTFSSPMDATLEAARAVDEGFIDEEAQEQIELRNRETSRYITPVQDFFSQYYNNPSECPSFFCDVIHLENNNVFTFAVTEGELIHWTNKRPEEDWLEWTERARVETEIDSPFRIQRAGEDIYLIDEDGIVYSTPAPPDNHHTRIGRISGWSSLLHGEELIILEDHAREKIGFFKVPVEGAVIPLIFEGHSDAAPDFHDKVPTPELEETLHEMAVIIRENRSDEK